MHIINRSNRFRRKSRASQRTSKRQMNWIFLCGKWPLEQSQRNGIAVTVSTFVMNVCALRTIICVVYHCKWSDDDDKETHARMHAQSNREMEMENEKNYESTAFKPQEMRWRRQKGTRKPHGNSKWGALCRRHAHFQNHLKFHGIFRATTTTPPSIEYNTNQMRWDEKKKMFVLISFLVCFFRSSFCNVLIIIDDFNGSSSMSRERKRELIKKD